MIYRGFRFKLRPTAEQESLFRQTAGVCRLVYNLALEQRRDWWRQHERITGKRINFYTQSGELTALRAEFDWIRNVTQSCEQQALEALDKAFRNFFAGRTGFPTPRRRGANDSFQFKGRDCAIKRLNGKWSTVRLPKIGWVKFRDTRPIKGAIKTVSVLRNALGWHVSFTSEIEHDAPAPIDADVGIDRGIANSLTLSTGEQFSVPATLRAIEKRRRRAQKIATRRKRGSVRYAKARNRVARLAARLARIRQDWHHKATIDLARRFGTVVLEDLKVANMTASASGTLESPGRHVRQKAGLNRSILNQAWYFFEATLAYKLEERGGQLIKVDPAYTSQTCSDCGTVDRLSRKSQARFACNHCGFEAHADHNAAINILRRNTASMRVEEGRQPSVEARTGGVFTHPENPPALAVGRC